MVNRGKQSLVAVAAFGACGCLASQAWAGDTLAKLLQSQANRPTVSSHSAPSRLPTAHLDLALPTAMPARENSRIDTESFSPAARHKAMSTETELPAAFSAVSNEPRSESKAEQLAKNFHREGLPVAKLFQSNDALVHIGLSPKGKPGLWLIKKLH